MEPARFYEFGPFVLDIGNRSVLRNRKPVTIQPRTYEVLLKLIENGGRTVTREELMAIWGLNVTEGALNYQINQARKALGDDTNNPQYIKTFPKVGFRFIADVRGFEGQSTPPSTLRISARSQALFGGHLGHVLIGCGMYAGLYSVMLLLEIAYQFDKYGRTALAVAPIVFSWIFGTSILALAVDWRRASAGKTHGLALSVSIFLGAAGLLYAGISFFLPASSITGSGSASYPAQASYLKDICYSLPLMLMFLAPTFHFVVALQRELHLGRYSPALELLTGGRFSVTPKGTIYPRFWMLSLALMIMAGISAFLTTNLLDHLSPSPYKNLFINLIFLRLILHFGLALKCLSWYHREVEEIKRECLLAEKITPS